MKQGVDYDAVRSERIKKAKLLGALFAIQCILDIAIIVLIAKMVVEQIVGG